MFYYENVSVKGSGKDKVSRHGTTLADFATYVILASARGCEVRECFYNGKTTCFEIHMDGEFLIKTNDKKNALSLFKDFSAI